MSYLTKFKWKKIDDENETCFVDGIEFKRKINAETVPVSCPVCKEYLITQEDIASYKEFECCENCELIYYYPNKEKWIKGWRPNLISSDIIINKDEVKND